MTKRIYFIVAILLAALVLGGGLYQDAPISAHPAPSPPAKPARRPPLATYVVDTTSDANLTACTGAANDCSLRGAINNANANPGLDTIQFTIPAAGVQTILTLSALPDVTGPTIIDGYTQPNSSCNTLATGDNAVLLIELNGNNTILNGLRITGGGSTVRGLVINRFTYSGLAMDTNGGNTIQGNFLGTNAAGTAALPNATAGVNITAGSPNNLVGGTQPCNRNLISGNGQVGVNISVTSATGNMVQGNYIGTTASGLAALGNQATAGVYIQATSNNQIGGTAQGAGNLISGNGGLGIVITDNGGTTTGNTIQGNQIGVTAGGGALGDGGAGISITGASGATNTLVGGAVGAGNRIANNNGIGVAVYGNPNLRNTIRANSITANNALGIDLAGNNVTPNDPLDPDTGPNLLQNFPLLGPGTTTLAAVGTINSTPGVTLTLDFYANATCDPLNYREGDIYLGSTVVATDGSGNATFNYTYAYGPAPAGSFITGTATDVQGNTSEFSPCQQAQQADSHAALDQHTDPHAHAHPHPHAHVHAHLHAHALANPHGNGHGSRHNDHYPRTRARPARHSPRPARARARAPRRPRHVNRHPHRHAPLCRPGPLYPDGLCCGDDDPRRPRPGQPLQRLRRPPGPALPGAVLRRHLRQGGR